MSNTYKDTLNLPKTDMPMKAGLTRIEPEVLEKWKTQKVYESRLNRNKDNTPFILHDGPPYPNGDIHLGHALNKILKDIVVKYHLVKGDYTPFIPGWDCHGLPIETQLLKALKKKEILEEEIDQFRDQCKEYALKYVDSQREQFLQLGVFGDYSNPYLTLTPQYEKAVIDLFGKLAENNLVYQGKKPIHWCFNCKTALAEAEIEYDDDRSPSIFVKFALVKELNKHKDVSLLVWTTTPWTLPANVAVAVNPQLTYFLASMDGEKLIFAEDLKAVLVEKLGTEKIEIIEKISGKDLLNIEYNHPFMNRVSPVVLADFVSNEDGTGLVHIAPGHGYEDYLVGLEYVLPIIMPVDEAGKFTEEAGKYEGLQVFEANKQIVDDLRDSGHLAKMEWMKHSYPHCWRCNSPVIFRATEQWFIAMDNETQLREQALKIIKDVKWYPDWGEKRITSMVTGRPDWCISRQRFWGIPIPVFYCSECNEPHYRGQFNKAVVDIVAKEGTNAWFTRTSEEILPKGVKCSKCGNSSFEKDSNIMDVWLESGASHYSVLNEHPQLSHPADLYLEGSDQHRGWFQSSLLTCAGGLNKSPYKAVLTHGFTIDEKGQKMSKSKGNTIAPQKVMAQHGADILRLWTSSTDFKNDVVLSENIIKQLKDAFSKIRNTLRFMISNLYDFNPETDKVENLEELDKWILAKTNHLVATVDKFYAHYDFHQIYHHIYNFCVIELSSLYLDIQKDNLYCNSAKSDRRRSAQTAMYKISHVMIQLLCPILSFSMEDVYQYLPGKKEKSIFLESFPIVENTKENDEIMAKFEMLLELRDKINIQLEALRKDRKIGSSLEAKVELSTPKSITIEDLNQVLVVSEIIVMNSKEESIKTDQASGKKCERCWKYDTLTDGLCKRCQSVVAEMK